MRGHVISYIEMCQKEGTSLQRGMNFRLKGRHSVILMSVRPNSPYRDEVASVCHVVRQMNCTSITFFHSQKVEHP